MDNPRVETVDDDVELEKWWGSKEEEMDAEGKDVDDDNRRTKPPRN